MATTEEAPLEERRDPDTDVLDLIDQGKRERALRLLMDRYGAPVYRFCRESVRSDARADDVHQLVFIQAHRDLPTFARRSSLKTWLFAIARHRVLDEVRRGTRLKEQNEQDDSADVADPAPTADERLDDERLQQALVACVSELPEDIRAAVLLRYQQGFSFEDMADMCSEKAGTLQARVSRALKRLHACIVKRTGATP